MGTTTEATETDCDLAIVGAGLAGGLIAMALTRRRPGLRLLLLDAADHAGGNHVWSWFDSDIDPVGRELLAPVVAHSWPQGHEVRFPSYRRRLGTGYSCIFSDRFDSHLRALLGERLLLGEAATRLTATTVETASGSLLRAHGVIDARGLPASFYLPSEGTSFEPDRSNRRDQTGTAAHGGGPPVFGPASSGAGPFLSPPDPRPPFSCGWQKFAGETLLLAQPHGLSGPIVMDATVDQREGYRFVYVLPLDPQRIFVEDTYYADEPHVDAAALSARIADYAHAQGWPVEAVLHRETGVLPVVKGGDFGRLWPVDDPVARAGTRAGLFHPTTGYSLPIAVDFALKLADEPDLSGPALARLTRALANKHWRRGGYYRLLDRMLFDAAPPEHRYRIFERFYRLPAPLIERFYAHSSTWADRVRILCGRPPVPIRAAMRALTKPQDI